MGMTKGGDGRGSPQLPVCSSNSMFDWVDNSCGMELFGCDGNCAASRNVFAGALRLQSQAAAEIDYHTLDYPSLHDEFLDSLLYEQTKECKKKSQKEGSLMDPAVAPRPESPSPKKRKRSIRLQHRRSQCKSPLKNSIQSTNQSTTVSLEDFTRLTLPEPPTYVHLHCRMQKDKGKGEDIGSNICAKGRDACLEKLRAKMKLLTDVVLDSAKGPATMKRRKAKISEEYDNFTETRSLIELNMGFLSMTYGVLLRWDTGKTGKITLIVLRKMCHESFYPTRTRVAEEPKWMSSIPEHPKSHVRDVIDFKHAIMQRQDGTEVTLLEPPYRVARPATFGPSVLTASVLFGSNMSSRSNWTVKLIYEDVSESVLLAWDEEQSCFVPKLGEPLKLTLQSLSLSVLTVKVYEHRLRRHYRRLVSTMYIPLNNLEPQRCSQKEPVRLMVPCKHDPGASIALGLNLNSDYGYWLNQELEARGREEVKNFVWRSPFRFVVDENEENEDAWDWICSVC